MMSIREIMEGGVERLSRASSLLAGYQAMLRLWIFWMVFAILSTFAALWLTFLRIIDWMAVPTTVILLLLGVLSRPRLPDYEQHVEEEQDEV